MPAHDSGADVVRYSFIAVDLHHLLLAGLPAHSKFTFRYGTPRAAADASIVSFRIRYQENAWRPITAIRAGYGGVAPDPNWESLLITPPHPDYPSAHCMATGAVAQVLRDYFGRDEVKFSYVFPPAVGMMRSYTSLAQIEKEMEDARVFAGIHFRSTNEHSTELGRRVGAYAVANHLRPTSEPRASR